MPRNVSYNDCLEPWRSWNLWSGSRIGSTSGYQQHPIHYELLLREDMAHTDYVKALGFLRSLDSRVVENDEEAGRLWANRTLPLKFTSDFDALWTNFPDENGEFVDKDGARFRIEAQPHRESECAVAYQLASTLRSIKTYPAIVVAKITWDTFLKRQTTEERRRPPQVLRQAFIDRFLSKVPQEWREVILIRDLHLRDDSKSQWVGNKAELPKVYKTLKHETNIRVVSIHPALESQETIRCSLQEVQLDSLTTFEALSYVWGPPSARRNSATQRFGRVMWIDAICINQSDVKERQAQVAQMDAIYKKAAEVVVWLGPETSTSSMLFTRQVDFTREALLHGSECFIKLLQRPYWDRMWVLQEAILAKNLTLQCGRKSTNWNFFHNLVFTSPRLARGLCSSGQLNLGRPFILSNQLQERISNLLPFLYLQSNTQFAEKLGSKSLATFLSMTAGSQASDPHDKIYGLLGLLPQGSTLRTQFYPNYSLSAKRLFIEVAKYFLDTTKSLGVLTARPLKKNPTAASMIDLPSWVPDWTVAADQMCNFVSLGIFSSFYARSLILVRSQARNHPANEASIGTPIFKAGLEVSADYPHSFSCFDEMFNVYGLAVDRIASVPRLVDEDPAIKSTVRDLRALKPQDLVENPELMGDTASELFNYPGAEDSKFPPQTQQDKEGVLGYMVSQARYGLQVYNTDFHGLDFPFFITTNGYIGVCHPDAAVGDVVAVLRGGSVPYILREYSQGHILVGECYVHGIMDGELIDRQTQDGNHDRAKGSFTKFRII
ncbi:Heterokaryon incompatibility protein [Apiospora rasikravindrae]|uniref:Heterokaryon incompatibility protein n=1 Tax=Apiospora rasikravindrae TaxID=990691 RepID=A0ABR1S513_9PEZI